MNYDSHYESVLRRAELFSYIADLVKTCPEGVEAADEVEAPPPPLAGRLGELLPRISVIDRRVLCNGASLDLARRPLTLRLFEAFCQAPGCQLTRDEVVQRVYQTTGAAARSERYLASAFNNSVKLISRARIMATACLSRGVGDGLEWFVYDQDQHVWSLYRLRTSYIAEKLG